jgi:elongator complex protein 3
MEFAADEARAASDGGTDAKVAKVAKAAKAASEVSPEAGQDSVTLAAQAWQEALQSGSATRESLRRLKQEAARRVRGPVPTDRDVAARLPAELRRRHAPLLATKPTRSQSGVAVVAVMSSPAACPHGKCSFCPGGPEVGVPQSYTGHEPSSQRAARLAYDPCRIVRTRLAQLHGNGHAVSKVDLVIQGGTFPARDEAYQDWFVAGMYAGCNLGPGDSAWEPLAQWQAMPEGERTARLAQLMRENEEAPCRAVGLTIETKPDWCLEPHVARMLRLGATRVEVGLQALDDAVLAATHRGHTLQDSRDALRIARDAGFKVCVHMMPGLPRPGAPSPPHPWPPRRGELDPDPVQDLADFEALFADPAWRPDMLKIYPTLVVEDGETLLKRQHARGQFHPYDTETAARVVALAKSYVPEWCRIQRVDRDIPTTHVLGGVQNSNLRQIAQAMRERMGLPPCRCIRCREVGRSHGDGLQAAPGEADAALVAPADAALAASDAALVAAPDVLGVAAPDVLGVAAPDVLGVAASDGLGIAASDGLGIAASDAFLVRRDYEASGGQEVFLSFEDRSDRILAFLRLRLPASGGIAYVRELKAYGVASDVGESAAAGSYQHRGLGASLLKEAERIAFGQGASRLRVIAGPGVKPYYRRHGYKDDGTYVSKHP